MANVIRALTCSLAAVALSGCAHQIAWYEEHTQPLPCDANLCTDEEWAAEERLILDPLDHRAIFGPHRVGPVTATAAVLAVMR